MNTSEISYDSTKGVVFLHFFPPHTTSLEDFSTCIHKELIDALDARQLENWLTDQEMAKIFNESQEYAEVIKYSSRLVTEKSFISKKLTIINDISSIEFYRYAQKYFEIRKELTPAMQDFLKTSYAGTDSGLQERREHYRVNKNYPKECEKVNQLWLAITLPGLRNKALESFYASRPWYERMIMTSERASDKASRIFSRLPRSLVMSLAITTWVALKFFFHKRYS